MDPPKTEACGLGPGKFNQQLDNSGSSDYVPVPGCSLSALLVFPRSLRPVDRSEAMLGSGAIHCRCSVHSGRRVRQSRRLALLIPGLPPSRVLFPALSSLPQPLKAQTEIAYTSEGTLSYFQCPLDWVEPNSVGIQTQTHKGSPTMQI